MVEFAPNSELEIIESGAFSYTGIIRISIPPLITKIREYVFQSCSNLMTIDIPENSEITSIESKAFMRSLVEKLFFPKKLSNLHDDWCAYTSNLNQIVVSPENKNFVFKDNQLLLGKTDPQSEIFDIVLFGRRDLETIEIPSNVKIINPYSFHLCEDLKNVAIFDDSDLHTIKNYAFAQSKIEKISLPKNVSVLGRDVFYSCYDLKFVEIPENYKLNSLNEIIYCGSPIIQFMIPFKLKNLLNSNP